MFVIVTYQEMYIDETLGFVMTEDGDGRVMMFNSSEEAKGYASVNLNEEWTVVEL